MWAALLYTAEGKPRVSIMSIAPPVGQRADVLRHDSAQRGPGLGPHTAGHIQPAPILYMDEIYGYFPPTANPPSKVPMLTLLKQARAFGVGVVLATQNPVDLDYKGLSNAGTWFLGRLQTQRDKDRVLEGLEGASSAAGQAFNRKKMDEILSGLGNRVFVMNNVHNDQPVVFQTRWALSYLRGPLTREQIQGLMAARKQAKAPHRRPRQLPLLAMGQSRPLPRLLASRSRRHLSRPSRSQAAIARSCRQTYPRFSDRAAARARLANPCSIGQRSWAWPGCIRRQESRHRPLGNRRSRGPDWRRNAG